MEGLGDCSVLYDPIKKQVLNPSNLHDKAPFHAHFKSLMTSGKRLKFLALLGRSLMCLVEVNISSSGASDSGSVIHVECAFADDWCCCLGRIHPFKYKLKTFALSLLLDIVHMDHASP